MPTIHCQRVSCFRRTITASTNTAQYGKFRQLRTTSAMTIMSPEQRSNESQSALQFIDIGANLLDERYIKGIYRGTYRHEPDIAAVIERAIQSNVQMIIITAGTVDESRFAIQQTRLWNQQYASSSSSSSSNIRFACTVGVHPTRCSQVFCERKNNETDSCNDDDDNDLENSEYADSKINELYDLCVDGMSDNTVIAYGECGLDYDRLEFCPMNQQKHYLYRQLVEIALPLNLPLFLHNRNVQDDLYAVLNNIRDKYAPTSNTKDDFSKLATERLQQSSTIEPSRKTIQDNWVGSYRGVVHSFDDTYELAMKFIEELQLYIGINGCSLRTEHNLATVKQLPLERILLETDCPYCDVRATHAGYQYIQTHFTTKSQSEKKFVMGQMVKSRQEPCHLIQIGEIIAGIKDMPLHSVADACYRNTLRAFFGDNYSEK